MKKDRNSRTRADFGLENRICALLQMYHIKRGAWFGGAKLNGFNCRRLMGSYKVIINDINGIFIDMNKGIK